MSIDVKPGSYPNAINPMSRGVIPVAILGSEDFSVEDVDVDSLQFGPEGAVYVHYAFEYVNEDDFMDLIIHFKTQDTGVMQGDVEACLVGTTLDDGTAIQGCDSIVTVPR